MTTTVQTVNLRGRILGVNEEVPLDINSGEYLPANFVEPIEDYLPLAMHST